MRRLEQRAMKRRALRDSNPDLAQAHRDERHKQKRNCTTPDPLSGEFSWINTPEVIKGGIKFTKKGSTKRRRSRRKDDG